MLSLAVFPSLVVVEGLATPDNGADVADGAGLPEASDSFANDTDLRSGAAACCCFAEGGDLLALALVATEVDAEETAEADDALAFSCVRVLATSGLLAEPLLDEEDGEPLKAAIEGSSEFACCCAHCCPHCDRRMQASNRTDTSGSIGAGRNRLPNTSAPGSNGKGDCSPSVATEEAEVLVAGTGLEIFSTRQAV